MAGAMGSATVLGCGVWGAPAYASTASGTMSGNTSVPQTPVLRRRELKLVWMAKHGSRPHGCRELPGD